MKIPSIIGKLHFSLSHSLPLQMQTEVAECGHACLSMIASYWGYKTDLTALRRSYPTSIRGVTLADLIAIAEHLNLVCRPLGLELEEIPQLRTPAVLHWNLDHFVVLKKIRRGKLIIHDPAKGRVTMTLAQASKHFTGVALEISPGSDFKEVKNRQHLTLGDMAGFIKGLVPQLGIILLISFAIELFSILSPLAMQFILDEVLPGHDVQLLYLLVIGFCCLTLLQATAHYTRSFTVLYLMNTLNIQIASNIFTHLLRLPLNYFEKRSTGDILSRFRAIDQIQQKITTDFVEGIVDGFMVIISLALMFVYSVKLSLIVCASMAVQTIIRIVFYMSVRRETEKQQVTMARENSCLIETIQSILPLKVFSRERDRQTLWQAMYADRLNSTIRLGRYQLMFDISGMFVSAIENTLVLLLATQAILAREFSAGMLIAYLAYRSQFVTTAQSLLNKLIDYKMISVLLDRLFDIVAEQRENITSLVAPDQIKDTTLRVSNICFTYPGADQTFGPLSLELPPGKILALSGPSGCGKTTLLKTIMSLLPPDSGTIMLGRQSVEHIGVESFRKLSAAVMQNDTLLSGSLLENISFFSRTPDPERAKAAARAAEIDDDIAQMPMNYQTLIGELGSSISGGQQQRLLLARALYHQPKLLFMDEATSHLDEETEWKILENLKSQDISLILITHRKSTLKFADQIIELG